MSPLRKLAIGLWALAFIFGGILAGRYWAQPGPPATTTAPPRVATPLRLPPITLTDLRGETRSLTDWSGRTLLINFWATWCTPCRTEMPYLDSLAAQKPDLLTLLAVNMREPEREITAFVEKLDLRLPILLAPDDAVLLAYNVRGLPLSYLIDPTGMLVQRIAGPLTPGLIEAQIDHVP